MNKEKEIRYLFDLEVGTKFYVINGAWSGRIFLKDGLKHFLLLERGTEHQLQEGVDYGLDFTTDEDYQLSLNGSHLISADPNCDHDVVSASGGGIKCTKCPGWYCE